MKYQIIVDEEIREQAAEAVAQGRILNLKNDIVFKSFFSKECKESTYCRNKMLSAVIGRKVKETKVLNPELLPSRTDGKFPRLDIHCKLEDGSEVDVEIQNSMYQDDQVKRSIYYAATLAHNSLTSGEPYSSLAHIYQIMFMDFITIKDKRLHHAYTFRERKDHTELSDIMQIHHIELPKIKELFNKPAAELSELEFWSILIMAGENKKARSLLSKLTRMQEEMDMAEALLDSMSRDQQEWENQIGYERFVHDCISREKYAFMRGEKQGIQQGIQQGLQQGERMAALANAKNLLKKSNLSIEMIAECCSLSLEQVLTLKEELVVAPIGAE